jgi:hypothetical protein
MPDFLKRISNKPVPANLLKAALSAIGELPEEDRKDITGRAIAVIRVLDEHNIERGLEERADLLTGIQFRLEALARLHNEPAFRAWSMKSGTPDMDYIHEDLVEAAAVEPLIMGEHQARFDANSFFKKVLQISSARGQA